MGVATQIPITERDVDGLVPSRMMRPSTTDELATVITAPVFPALTMPSALASRTNRAATCTELSFLRRNAWAG